MGFLLSATLNEQFENDLYFFVQEIFQPPRFHFHAYVKML